MAKAKSKKIMLEDAIVPVDEQPYHIPENWCWTRIKHVSDVVTGSTPSKKHAEYYGGDFPFFKPADLEAGDNVVEATEYLSEEGKNVSRIIPKLSTAVCCIGSIGKTGLIRVEGTTNQQINSMIPKINPLYLYYYSKSNVFIEELWNKSTATTISLVNKKNMETNTIPLAPLAEQKRIVEQIESLFSKLDEAKEKAQEVIDGYEARNAAVYNDAFSGRLTAQWRKDNYKENKWETKRFDEVADIKSNLVEPSNYLELQTDNEELERRHEDLQYKNSELRNVNDQLFDDNHTLEQQNDSLQSYNQELRQKYNDLKQDNVKLEKQQNELKRNIEQMVQSEQLLQRDVRKYDEAPEWQLPEQGAFASAKSFRDKVVMPFVNKLKTLIKNLTIQCLRLKEEVLQLRKEEIVRGCGILQG